MAPQELPELQVKYYDWCSGRVWEHLLRLPHDQVQSLVERAPDVQHPLDFVRIRHPLAERLIRAAFHELALPSFESWAEEYRRDPAQYEKDLLGFRSPAAVNSTPS